MMPLQQHNKDLLISDKDIYQQFRTLMESAFPPEERRTAEDFVKQLDKSAFHADLYVMHQQLVAFNCWWHFGTFRFVEHLAVHEAVRGTKVVGLVLTNFLQSERLPVLFEVEPPDSRKAANRIAFYKRKGLFLYKTEYWQPPYHQGAAPLHMLLMGSIPEPSPALLTQWIGQVHRAVYGYDTGPAFTLNHV